MSKFNDLCKSLEDKIISAYEQGVSLDEAERLASEFLYGQIAVSVELKKASLDARMRKSGMKALRASLYLNEVQKGDKKPTEAMLTALLDSNEVIQGEQQALDESEVSREDLERYFSIFQNSHIHFRGVAKGRME